MSLAQYQPGRWGRPNKSDAGQPAPISWPSSFGSFDSAHSLESAFMWLRGWCLIQVVRSLGVSEEQIECDAYRAALL